jgi:hypothetical protein
MSTIDSELEPSAFANPLSPLHQSLIRAMPNTTNLGSQFAAPVGADDQAATLFRAHNLRTGRVSSGQMLPPTRQGSPGPVGTSLSKYKLALMAAVGMSEEDQDKFKPIVEDPNISPQALHQLIQMHQSRKGGQQHDFNSGQQQQQTPNNGASIGGAAPANLAPGTIQITRGSGPRGMSEEAMSQWMRQAAHAGAGTGESVSEIPGQPAPVPGHGVFNYQKGTVEQQTRPTTAGFQVGGIQAPAQQGQGQSSDPVVGMYQALAGAGADPKALEQWKAFAQAGATPEQLHQAGQQIMAQHHQQGTEQRAERREEAQGVHTEFAENARVLDELQKQETALNKRKEEGEPDPTGAINKDLTQVRTMIQNVRGRLNQAVTPQQQPTQGAGQPTQNAGLPTPGAGPAAGRAEWRGNSYQLGQVIQTPQGPARVAGFAADGHPLMQLSGR